ncbi:cytochrome P450 2C31-like [Hemicordylus capensis]|uniref:cytochrome P450 2C31-like n=1 Tax=Hemicordylus capensis TaxID=884348 RepID=UPI002304A76A|nr:cytochrome P450 2C31-like [Hemicordylus capensis]
MMIGGFLAAFAICFLVVHYVKLLWIRRRFPSGPMPLPLIGSLWKVGWKIRQDTLMKLASSYGNVFTIWIGHVPLVVLSGFKTVHSGLTDHSEALSGRPMTLMIKVLGNGKGIMFSNGKTWKQQRQFGHSILQKMMQGKKVLEHQIEEEAHQLVEAFAREKGQPLDPSLPILHSVSKVICALAFGQPHSMEDEVCRKLTEHINILNKLGGSVGDIIFEILPSFMRHIIEPNKKVLSSCEDIRSFIRKEVEKHKKKEALPESQGYIDYYLAKMDKEKADHTSTFDEDNLVQALLDLFAAGTDMISTTLLWALLLMVAHPDIQEKVQKELGSELGFSKSICYGDWKKVPYTYAVVHEIQRFSNIVLFGLPKLSVDNMNVSGHFIPKETLVVPDLCSVLLDPKHWETPQQFNPNHFLDKHGNFTAREEFLPFGAGSRACLAEHIARVELFVFFTSLLRAFTFQLPEGVKEVNTEPVVGSVMRPHPYKLCAVPH